jgi:molybdate transport system regulatory protein
MPTPANHSRIISAAENGRCLDAVQLEKLEHSFRSWANAPKRHDHQTSRNRILLIFYIIRYTAARLSEVLNLRSLKSFDFQNHMVRLCKVGSEEDLSCREIQIPETISLEIKKILNGPGFGTDRDALFKIDPGHVRRKFYERAVACGFAKELGGPDVIRRSRAVELMQSNMPLPVVQTILGHSTPNLVASYVDFSDNDIRQVAKFYLEKESKRKTSARNTFFGKVSAIRHGDVQVKIELTTIGGEILSTVITIDSLERLGVKTGSLITAEVKAPWVFLQKRQEKPECTAENMFLGTIDRINKGKVVTEYVVRIADGTEICSIVTTESARKLDLKKNDPVWAIFNAFSVVLNID